MRQPAEQPPVLKVSGLISAFRDGSGWRPAVDGADLAVPRGRTVALMGESGSGKSVTALSVMRLLRAPNARIVSGRILFRGRDDQVRDLAALDERAMRRIRGNEIGMVFQEPLRSLNPTATVGRQIEEAIRLHRPVGRASAASEAVRLLDQVRIADARRRADAYPHHLSGGMCQRVMIAMALANRPSLLLADEPTTALDVTVQSEILRLIRTLQAELGMGVLFITHDLGVVAEIADRVDVMYAGQVIESAPVATLFDAPRHPYTRALLRSRPGGRGQGAAHRLLPTLPGSAPHGRSEQPGCRFAARCELAVGRCLSHTPSLDDVAHGHLARCLRWRELA